MSTGIGARAFHIGARVLKKLSIGARVLRKPHLHSSPASFESWPPCSESRPRNELGMVFRYTSGRVRFCSRRNRPPSDAEAVKELPLSDQLGTNGSAGGKLPAGKETSRRPVRRAS